MYFTSYAFLAFLALVFVGYYGVFKRHQWQFLLVASFVFYACSGWQNLLYISATIVSTYLLTCKMDDLLARQEAFVASNKDTIEKDALRAYRAKVKAQRKWLLVAILVINFSILAVVKYTDFVISNINSLRQAFSLGEPLSFLNLALPLGISFYTFQTMGYAIDSFRAKKSGQVERNLFKLALFTSFFPQLIQGPISRFGDLKKSLFSPKELRGGHVSKGLLRVCWGFFLKLVVADRLMIPVKALVSQPDVYQGIYVLLAMGLYAITLFADFSGGIGITIGVAKMLGIDVAENFNRPFYSKSIAEYWRRWHITMGSWFRDYLFYPMSVSKPFLKLMKASVKTFGNKVGSRIPVYLSMMILWFFTGLWHGASWNFIVWGLANGVVIATSQELTPLYQRFHTRFAIKETRLYRGFEVVRTFVLMCFIRTFDIYASVGLTFAMFGSIFTAFITPQFASVGLGGLGLGVQDYVVAGVAVLVMVVVGVLKERWKDKALGTNVHVALSLLLLLCILVFGVYGLGYDANQFIYNQF